MSAFVDRLAKAASAHILRRDSYLHDPADKFCACRACLVRAILAEAREAVTHEMLHAGMISISVPDSAVKIAWQAMIDVALAPDGLKTGSAGPVDGD